MTDLVDHNGWPMRASSYNGSDRFGPDLQKWMPMLTAADDDVLADWEVNVGRLRELVSENGLTSGAVQSHLDNIIGTGLRAVAKPDWRALRLSEEWAGEFQQQAEAVWREWADDNMARCHAAGVLDFTGLLAQAYRSWMAAGEITATSEWLERDDWGFRTAIQPIDPERLSNPAGRPDTLSMRAGVEKGAHGEPVAYHVREGHPNALLGIARQDAYRWQRVPRHTEFGRRLFIHIFDQRRPGQTRGQTGMLAGIKQVKMMERWQQTSLQAAIINSMYAAVIESGMDHPAVIEALSSHGENPLSEYMGSALEFHSGTNKIQWDGSKIAHLFPGEKLNMLKAEQPVAAFEQFESAALRNLAASWNMSYEQLSRDYSKTNYSSARASMLEAWKFIIGQRHKVAGRFASECYALVIEDAIDSGRIELPRGAPGFYERGAKAAYTRAEWLGPGREHIDPVKGEKATEMSLANGTTTLEAECASRGLDYREVIRQRAREQRMLEAAGLPLPGATPMGPGEPLNDPEDQA